MFAYASLNGIQEKGAIFLAFIVQESVDSSYTNTTEFCKVFYCNVKLFFPSNYFFYIVLSISYQLLIHFF